MGTSGVLHACRSVTPASGVHVGPKVGIGILKKISPCFWQGDVKV